MAIWISDSNAVPGTAKSLVRDCCKRKINRIYLKSDEYFGSWIVICKVCGAKHYGVDAESANLMARK